MILDFNPSKSLFFLRVPRATTDIQELITGHGLNLSLPASTATEACLFTPEPYAVAAFFEHGTPAAQDQLRGIHEAIEASWKPEGQGHYRMPAGQELWPFQRASLEYALAREHALIGDEPGLGKTPIAICYANEIQAKRTLVICPANIRLQWQKVIYRWSTQPWPYHVHVITNSRHGVHPTAAWTIVSYDLARTPAIGGQLALQDFDVLILDEAHALKTIDSKRTRAVFGGGENRAFAPIAGRARHTLALTGTPLPNRPREAYTIARALCLGTDTRVLTNHGWKPICSIESEDLLWDGVDWTSHGGLVYKGMQSTISAMGLEATGNHEILCGGTWRMWSDVVGCESTRSHALETGLESLRSLGMSGSPMSVKDEPGTELTLLSSVAAGESHTSLPLVTYGNGSGGARSAQTLFPVLIPTDGLAHPDCQLPSATVYSIASGIVSPGARTQKTNNTRGMEAGASGCTLLGSWTKDSSSPTWPPSLAVARPDTNWTGATMTGDTSPETCAGCPSRPICRTGEPLTPCPVVYKNLRHVYDILNSGPRSRFTVLTAAGPLVVHNCWDAIDWMSEDRFNDRFNPSVKREVYDAVTGRMKMYVDERTGRHAELSSRLRANFMVRHQKRTVMPQLKLPVYDLIRVEETRAVKAALAAERLLDINPDTLEGADMTVLGHIAAVRKQMGIAIAPLAAEYVEMLLDGGEEKITLFGHHIAVLDIWTEMLAKFNPVRIDGSVGPAARQARVDKFVSDPTCRIILGNLQSMGTGTDGLQAVCSHGIIAEPSWTTADNIQAFDRLDRGGQTRTVQCDVMVAPGSIGEKILASALRKGQVIHATLDKRH